MLDQYMQLKQPLISHFSHYNAYKTIFIRTYESAHLQKEARYLSSTSILNSSHKQLYTHEGEEQCMCAVWEAGTARY